MAIDPTSPSDFKRLADCVESSCRHLQPFRMELTSSLREMVGKHYSWNGNDREVLVNHVMQGAVIYTRSLAAKNPEVLVTTHVSDLKPVAWLLQQSLTKLLTQKEVQFEKTLRAWIFDSLFCMGITKIGMTTEETADEDSDATVFFKTVHMDDWVHDTRARTWDECRYYGNKFRMPLSKARELGMYSKKARQDLTETKDHNEPFEKAASLSMPENNSSTEADLEPSIDLWQVYLPHEKLVATWPCDNPKQALAVNKWDGPEEGPYERLAYIEVPKNVMPLAPVMDWRPLHDLSNRIFRKMSRQGDRFKELLLLSDGMAKDGERLVNASDGDAIKVESPEKAQVRQFGGVNANLLGFWTQLKQINSWAQGNTESLGGLEPQSPTLGQDKLLSQQANARLADMSQMVEQAVGRVVKRLAEYLWTDELIELPMTHRMGRVSGIEVSQPWTPEERRGDFLAYNFELTPYSMQPKSPQQQLQTILQLLPIYAQMGVQLNAPRLTELLAKYAGISDLDDIVAPGVVAPQQMVGSPGNKIKSSMERTYKRVSVSGTPQPSSADQITTGLMNQQPGANIQAVQGAMR